MSIQRFSYHCHSNFSDGSNTLEEMIFRAEELGFTELGISDHVIIHKNIDQSPSQPYWQKNSGYNIFKSSFKKALPEFQQHCDNIRQASKKHNMKLLVGFEVDFFTYDGWLEEFKEFVSQLDCDYLVSGNHMLFDEKCETMFDIGNLKKIYSDAALQQELLRRHFETMKLAVKSGMFTFLAHMDYARKLGDDICSADSFKPEKVAVLDSLQQVGMGVEISTKGLRRIGDFYPCECLIDEFAKRNLPVVISDDAHNINEMGYRFDYAEEVLQKHCILNRLHL